MHQLSTHVQSAPSDSERANSECRCWPVAVSLLTPMHMYLYEPDGAGQDAITRLPRFYSVHRLDGS